MPRTTGRRPWNQSRYHVLFAPGGLRNADPGQPLIAESDHRGFFFPYDPPGRYSVTAEIPRIDEEKLRQSEEGIRKRSAGRICNCRTTCRTV